VTLILASVFMAGWVRSVIIPDEYFQFTIFGTMMALRTEDQTLEFSMQLVPGSYDEPVPPSNGQSSGASVTIHSESAEENSVDSETNALAITVPVLVWNVQLDTVFALPFWSITVPLTLISVWLLLIKPRLSTLKKSCGLVPDKSA
jgi:hypothetical protein